MSDNARAAGERRHMSPATLISFVMLALQLCALVWGAATLNAGVTGLKDQVGGIQGSLSALNANVQTLSVDVAVLKAGKK